MTPPVYRVFRFYRVQILAMFALFIAATVVMAGAIALGRSDVDLPFFLSWLGGMAWCGYWFLFAIGGEMSIEDDKLCWRAPLRERWVPLAELSGISPLAFQLQTVRWRGGRPLLIWVNGDFKAFAQQVASRAPQAEIRVGWYGRTSARAAAAGASFADGRPWLAKAFAATSAVCWVLFIVGVSLGGARSEAIVSRSRPVTATVVDFTSQLRAAREATVRYPVDGRTVESSVILHDDSVEIGDEVPLLYDPEHPRRVFEENENEPPGGEPPLWVGPAFVGGIGSAVAAVRVRRRRRSGR